MCAVAVQERRASRGLVVTSRAPTVPVPQDAEARATSIGRIVEKMYANFNACDVDGTADCFTKDVVYEDLLLGNSTIVESREDFRELIQTHPVFVAERACEALGLPPLDVAVRVDGLSEDLGRHSVGVEWHVEVGGRPLALGRGLSYMRICPRTGLIQRAVDIAEAPWRAVGLFIAPFARGIRGLSRVLTQLLLPPVLISGSSTLLLLSVALIFLDRSFMHDLREGVDELDDFRETIDIGLFDTLKDLSGLYPWEN